METGIWFGRGTTPELHGDRLPQNEATTASSPRWPGQLGMEPVRTSSSSQNVTESLGTRVTRSAQHRSIHRLMRGEPTALQVPWRVSGDGWGHLWPVNSVDKTSICMRTHRPALSDQATTKYTTKAGASSDSATLQRNLCGVLRQSRSPRPVQAGARGTCIIIAGITNRTNICAPVQMCAPRTRPKLYNKNHCFLRRRKMHSKTIILRF